MNPVNSNSLARGPVWRLKNAMRGSSSSGASAGSGHERSMGVRLPAQTKPMRKVASGAVTKIESSGADRYGTETGTESRVVLKIRGRLNSGIEKSALID